jgi:crotonobetainyl-CoA:carnitine CoA-transferase CaiB-like acyl-CoA transferase
MERGELTMMQGPLSGHRVLDLSTMLAGPWCADILGDQGADVIKVEVPRSGDHVRSLRNRSGGLPSMFVNINRSKRSIELNLKDEEGRAVFLDLVRDADVVIQNFRPGVVDRLGIGYDAARDVNPAIVYLSLSGFGERGPYAHKRVYDPVVQALSGLTTIQAGSDDERPRLIRTVLPDKLTAVTGAQAVTAALLARVTTGVGQHVRLSMLDSVVAFLWASDMGGQTFVDQPASAQSAASFRDLIYETRDGHITVSVMSNGEWEALCRALEKPEWLADERFSTPAGRDEHVDERLAMTQTALLERTADEWLEILDRHDVPCARALTRNELIEHPQIVESEIVIQVDHPKAGRLRQARPPARFEATPVQPPRGAPHLGQHTSEVLTELGYNAARIAALRDRSAIGSERNSDHVDRVPVPPPLMSRGVGTLIR